MKLKQLQALRAVRNRQPARRGRRLCVTQPAVSRAIIDLESELGVPLLTRTARGALLTGFGASILKRALLIDREVGIYDAADAERGAAGGSLCIAITPVSATEAFLDAVTAFAAERPDVRLSILELRRAQIVAGLKDGSLDIALYTEYGLLEDAAPHYRLESLYEIGSALAVSGGYAGPLDVSAEDLQAQRWMVLDAASDESSLMRVLFSKHGLAPPARVLLLVRLCLRQSGNADGCGVDLERCRRESVGRASAQRALRRLNVAGGMPQGAVCMAYPDENLMTPAARDFISWLRMALRKPGSSAGVTVGID